MLKHYEEHTAGNIEYMTGPHNYHPHGVAVVLKRNNCTTLPDQAEEEGLQLVREGHPCEKTQEPEPIGVVQVRALCRFSAYRWTPWHLELRCRKTPA